MVEKKEILKGLAKATIEGDAESCKKFANEVLKAKIDAYEGIIGGCAKGMEVVSDRYEKGEMFVPEILLSAEAMYGAINILKPHLKIKAAEMPGTVVIGVIEGDIHDIGKNLARIMLDAAGLKVIDLGRDVPLKEYLDKAKENNADIVAMSTLMTTTMAGLGKVVNMYKEQGVRDKVKIVIGGAPLSQDFADEIGVDKWAKDAVEGVALAKKMTKELRKTRGMTW